MDKAKALRLGKLLVSKCGPYQYRHAIYGITTNLDMGSMTNRQFVCAEWWAEDISDVFVFHNDDDYEKFTKEITKNQSITIYARHASQPIIL